MQRIWITGSSGSGKTTLAKKLGDKLNIPVYHRDAITWKENWEERSQEEQIALTKEITKRDKWIFEGNMFTASRLDGRFDKCDTIIFLNINRFICLYRGLRRYFKHKNNPRPELNKGCDEEYDMTVVKYVLLGFPKKKSSREKFFSEAKKLGKKVIILNGQKEVNNWYNRLEP